MKKEELTIKLETLTPIWTGNAFGECEEIKGQSMYGGLRYWFELYCKSVGIPVKNFQDEELDEEKYTREIKYIIRSQGNLSIDRAKKIALNRCNITLASQIFGCKGLKGNLEIKSIESKEENINKNDIDFNFLGRNIKPWMERNLFINKAKSIKCHKDVVIKTEISSSYLWEFKRFLKYYKDNTVLMGGKKSIGFGFAKLTTDEPLTGVGKVQGKEKLYIFRKVKLGKVPKNKETLGFSFKYYFRKEENKKCGDRKKKSNKAEDNFGKMGISSRFYFSNVVGKEGNKYVYVLGFPNGNIEDDNDFRNDFNKYCNCIEGDEKGAS